jgi:hypothetical protein
MRRNITGTNEAAVALCFSIHASDSSGSNFSGSTSVAPRAAPNVNVARPNEWNIGAGQKMTSSRR